MMADSLFFVVLCGLGFLAGIACVGILTWWLASGRSRSKWMLGPVLACLAVGVVVLAIFLLKPPVERDLSLDGGYICTLQVAGKVDETGVLVGPAQNEILPSIEAIRGRLDQIGHDDALIQDMGGGRIRIEIYGAGVDEAEVMQRVVVKSAKLELRQVHPESASMAPRVKAGETIVPGFMHYEYRSMNGDGEEFREDLLLSKRVQVEGRHVKHASVDASQPGVVNIRLSSEGGDRMIQLTKGLTPMRDRIAVVLDDEVMSAPVVMSVPLGSMFMIDGLEDDNEAHEIAMALMNPLAYPVEVLEGVHVAAVAVDGERARRVAGSWSHIEFVVGIIIGCGVLVLGVTTLGVISFSAKRQPEGSHGEP